MSFLAGTLASQATQNANVEVRMDILKWPNWLRRRERGEQVQSSQILSFTSFFMISKNKVIT